MEDEKGRPMTYWGGKPEGESPSSSSRCSALRRWWIAFVTWRKDPFRIERDWEDFSKMSDDELRKEFDRHIDEGTVTSNRFRRLCQHLSIRWMTDA
jgi:hypothetical protein